MSWNRSTVPELLRRVKRDIKSGLNIKNILPVSLESGFAKAIMGMTHELYGYLEFSK